MPLTAAPRRVAAESRFGRLLLALAHTPGGTDLDVIDGFGQVRVRVEGRLTERPDLGFVPAADLLGGVLAPPGADGGRASEEERFLAALAGPTRDEEFEVIVADDPRCACRPGRPPGGAHRFEVSYLHGQGLLAFRLPEPTEPPRQGLNVGGGPGSCPRDDIRTGQ